MIARSKKVAFAFAVKFTNNPHLLNGLNVCQGQVTYEAVARDLGYDFVDPATLLG